MRMRGSNRTKIQRALAAWQRVYRMFPTAPMFPPVMAMVVIKVSLRCCPLRTAPYEADIRRLHVVEPLDSVDHKP